LRDGFVHPESTYRPFLAAALVHVPILFAELFSHYRCDHKIMFASFTPLSSSLCPRARSVSPYESSDMLCSVAGNQLGRYNPLFNSGLGHYALWCRVASHHSSSFACSDRTDSVQKRSKSACCECSQPLPMTGRGRPTGGTDSTKEWSLNSSSQETAVFGTICRALLPDESWPELLPSEHRARFVSPPSISLGGRSTRQHQMPRAPLSCI
jgi:hypothetical protein